MGLYFDNFFYYTSLFETWLFIFYLNILFSNSYILYTLKYILILFYFLAKYYLFFNIIFFILFLIINNDNINQTQNSSTLYNRMVINIINYIYYLDKVMFKFKNLTLYKSIKKYKFITLNTYIPLINFYKNIKSIFLKNKLFIINFLIILILSLSIIYLLLYIYIFLFLVTFNFVNTFSNYLKVVILLEYIIQNCINMNIIYFYIVVLVILAFFLKKVLYNYIVNINIFFFKKKILKNIHLYLYFLILYNNYIVYYILGLYIYFIIFGDNWVENLYYYIYYNNIVIEDINIISSCLYLNSKQVNLIYINKYIKFDDLDLLYNFLVDDSDKKINLFLLNYIEDMKNFFLLNFFLIRDTNNIFYYNLSKFFDNLYIYTYIILIDYININKMYIELYYSIVNNEINIKSIGSLNCRLYFIFFFSFFLFNLKLLLIIILSIFIYFIFLNFILLIYIYLFIFTITNIVVGLLVNFSQSIISFFFFNLILLFIKFFLYNVYILCNYIYYYIIYIYDNDNFILNLYFFICIFLYASTFDKIFIKMNLLFNVAKSIYCDYIIKIKFVCLEKINLIKTLVYKNKLNIIIDEENLLRLENILKYIKTQFQEIIYLTTKHLILFFKKLNLVINNYFNKIYDSILNLLNSKKNYFFYSFDNFFFFDRIALSPVLKTLIRHSLLILKKKHFNKLSKDLKKKNKIDAAARFKHKLDEYAVYKDFIFAVFDAHLLLLDFKEVQKDTIFYSRSYDTYKNVYKTLIDRDNFKKIFFISKFKINFRYSISLKSNENTNYIISFSIRNFYKSNLLKINNKSRFLISNFFLLNLLKRINKFDFYKNYLIIRNFSFLQINILKDFFKFLNKMNLDIHCILFNFNINFKYNKYNKKLKTKKKFKKKIYNSIFQNEYKKLFIYKI